MQRSFPLYLILILAATVAMVPFAWMVSASLMTESDVVARRLLPSAFHWKNYVDAWQDAQFGLYFRNSLIIAGLQVLGIPAHQ